MFRRDAENQEYSKISLHDSSGLTLNVMLHPVSFVILKECAQYAKKSEKERFIPTIPPYNVHLINK